MQNGNSATTHEHHPSVKRERGRPGDGAERLRGRIDRPQPSHWALSPRQRSPTRAQPDPPGNIAPVGGANSQSGLICTSRIAIAMQWLCGLYFFPVVSLCILESM